MSRNKNIFTLVALFGILGVIAGCGPATQVTQLVEGTVVMKESPVASASVTFYPKDETQGSVAGGMTDENGKFKVQTLRGKPDAGTTPGEYIVTVQKMESVPSGAKTTNAEGETVDEMKDQSVLPVVYATKETSPLTVTVTAGKNTIDITLDEKAR